MNNIIDPSDNQAYSIHSKNGKRLLKNYIKFYNVNMNTQMGGSSQAHAQWVNNNYKPPQDKIREIIKIINSITESEYKRHNDVQDVRDNAVLRQHYFNAGISTYEKSRDISILFYSKLKHKFIGERILNLHYYHINDPIRDQINPPIGGRLPWWPEKTCHLIKELENNYKLSMNNYVKKYGHSSSNENGKILENFKDNIKLIKNLGIGINDNAELILPPGMCDNERDAETNQTQRKECAEWLYFIRIVSNVLEESIRNKAEPVEQSIKTLFREITQTQIPSLNKFIEFIKRFEKKPVQEQPYNDARETERQATMKQNDFNERRLNDILDFLVKHKFITKQDRLANYHNDPYKGVVTEITNLYKKIDYASILSKITENPYERMDKFKDAMNEYNNYDELYFIMFAKRIELLISHTRELYPILSELSKEYDDINERMDYLQPYNQKITGAENLLKILAEYGANKNAIIRIPEQDRYHKDTNPRITDMLFSTSILMDDNETDVKPIFENLSSDSVFKEYVGKYRENRENRRNKHLFSEEFTNAIKYLINGFVRKVLDGDRSYSDKKPDLSQASPALPQAKAQPEEVGSLELAPTAAYDNHLEKASNSEEYEFGDSKLSDDFDPTLNEQIGNFLSDDNDL